MICLGCHRSTHTAFCDDCKARLTMPSLRANPREFVSLVSLPEHWQQLGFDVSPRANKYRAERPESVARVLEWLPEALTQEPRTLPLETYYWFLGLREKHVLSVTVDKRDGGSARVYVLLHEPGYDFIVEGNQRDLVDHTRKMLLWSQLKVLVLSTNVHIHRAFYHAANEQRRHAPRWFHVYEEPVYRRVGLDGAMPSDEAAEEMGLDLRNAPSGLLLQCVYY